MEHLNLGAHDRLIRRQRVPTTVATAATTTRGVAGTAVATTARPPPTTTRAAPVTTTSRTTARTTTARTTTERTTGRGVATYATTAEETTAPAATTTSARSRSSASVISSRTSSSASPSNTALTSSSGSGSFNNTSTIVGVVCAIAGVALLIAIFFGVRKYRAKKAARAGGAGFTKHDEDDDVFGNSHADPNNGGGEKLAQNQNQSYGATGGNSPGLVAGAGAGAAAGMAGFGAAKHHQQQQQQQQFRPQQQQPQHDSRGWDSPSYPVTPYPATPSSYPPPSSASSVALLDQQQQYRSSRYEDSPYGAGAAGGGALARIEETNGMSLPVMPNSSPFVEVPSQGKIHIVKRTFEPTLGDELVIFPGDRVQVLLSFDDGWALGINLDAPVAGTKGVFPFDCLDDPTGAAAAAPSQQQQQQQQPAPSPALTSAPLPTQIPYNSPSMHVTSPSDAPRALSPFSDPSAPRPESPFAPTQSPSFAPQLAPLPLRSDSPLNFGPGPTINVTREDDMPAPLPSPRAPEMDMYEQQQQPPPSLQAGNRASLLVQGNREGDKGKRTSSLIASRDASLFMALGEVLDDDEPRRQ